MSKLESIEIMIDLETLGTSNKAPVVSIGCVAFDGKVIYDQLYLTLNLKEQIDIQKRLVDADTLQWWFSQSNDVRAVFKENKKGVVESLTELTQFINKFEAKKVYVWGNGANFDITILESLYKDFELKVPWKYGKIMDLRTIRRFLGGNEKIKVEGVKHNALSDALAQAKYLQKWLSDFRELKKKA